MKAVGYCRVSSEGQAKDGASLDAQQARIEAWSLANGCELATVHVDAGLSGGRADNRPALQAALAEACKLKAILVVYSLSRLARSTTDAIAISERLSKSGADLVSLSERIDSTSAAGKMVFRMLAVLAEFERDQVAERTRTALAHLRHQGKRISGRIPFGYSLAVNGVDLIPHAKEQEAIRLMQELRTQDCSLREIAAALTERGIPTKTRTAWSPESIRGILRKVV
ncbi:MAG: recombinase family protein [Nitrospira sp.]|nr:MAG: recombinase family protein [Nitrospira sp.]